MDDQIPHACQNIRNLTSCKICPHHNGGNGPCTTNSASDCDIYYWRSKWFWNDQVSSNPMYWLAKRFHILLPGPTHQYLYDYWNSPTYHNILDHSQGDGCVYPQWCMRITRAVWMPILYQTHGYKQKKRQRKPLNILL